MLCVMAVDLNLGWGARAWGDGGDAPFSTVSAHRAQNTALDNPQYPPLFACRGIVELTRYSLAGR